MAHTRRKFVDVQKVQPKGKTGRADVALMMINRLYGIERALKDASDEQHLSDHHPSPALAKHTPHLQVNSPIGRLPI